MRIAIDATTYHRRNTGVGRHVYHVVHALGKLRTPHRFVVLHAPEGRAIARGAPSSLRFVEIGAPLRLLRHGGRRIGFPPAQLFAGGLDAVHGPCFLPFPALGVPFTITIHDLGYRLFPETVEPGNVRWLSRHLARAAARAGAILVPSETVRRQVVALLGVEPAKVRVGPNAADPALGPGSREVPSALAALGVRRPYLLFVSTIEPRKDVPTLLRAFAALRRSGRIAHRLVLAGRPGWGTEAARAAARACDVERDVDWLGYVDGSLLPALHRCADAFVFPSIYEGFGMPPLDALACGTPVIASDAPALPEVLQDGAAFFPAGDAAALARRIEEVLGDEGLRRDLARRGAGVVRAYSWEATARITLEAIEDAARARVG